MTKIAITPIAVPRSGEIKLAAKFSSLMLFTSVVKFNSTFADQIFLSDILFTITVILDHIGPDGKFV